ncbi:MAG: hypothetical protein QOG11_1024 [Solirubrobacteraceae bacterium]|nr:hypothetical protein [Solirubrobacteraceae bacterium]
MRQFDNYQDPWHALRHEVDRSRRHGHPAALVRIAPATASASADRRARRELNGIAQRLQGLLRTIDCIWLQKDAVYVLLPEADRDSVEALIARLRRVAPGLLPAGGVTMACFPEDGLTANALRATVSEVPKGAIKLNPGRLARPSAARFERAQEADQS